MHSRALCLLSGRLPFFLLLEIIKRHYLIFFLRSETFTQHVILEDFCWAAAVPFTPSVIERSDGGRIEKLSCSCSFR